MDAGPIQVGFELSQMLVLRVSVSFSLQRNPLTVHTGDWDGRTSGSQFTSCPHWPTSGIRPIRHQMLLTHVLKHIQLNINLDSSTCEKDCYSL